MHLQVLSLTLILCLHDRIPRALKVLGYCPVLTEATQRWPGKLQGSMPVPDGDGDSSAQPDSCFPLALQASEALVGKHVCVGIMDMWRLCLLPAHPSLFPSPLMPARLLKACGPPRQGGSSK